MFLTSDVLGNYFLNLNCDNSQAVPTPYSHTVRIIVTDDNDYGSSNGPLSCEVSHTFNILSTNHNPVHTVTNPDKDILNCQYTDYTPSGGSDPDGDALVWSASNSAHAWVDLGSFVPATGYVRFSICTNVEADIDTSIDFDYHLTDDNTVAGMPEGP